VGNTYDEFGSSHYFDLFAEVGNNTPKVYPREAKKVFNALSKSSSKKIIKAMHDCSEGGIGVAAAEMAFSGGLGMDIFLSEVPYSAALSSQLSAVSRLRKNRNDYILFSESNSRFIVEVEKRHQKEFEAALKGLSYGLIGCITKEKDFKVFGVDGKLCVNANITELKEAWAKPLRW